MSIIINGQTRQAHAQIVTSGLAIALDIADNRCYTSGSRTLYNLSATSSRYITNATLTPSASWVKTSTGGAGSLAFSGSYAYYDYNYQTPSGSIALQSYTLLTWVSGSSPFFNVGTGLTSQNMGTLGYGSFNSYFPTFYLRSQQGQNTQAQSTIAIDPTRWNQIGVSAALTGNRAIRLYINGVVSSITTANGVSFNPPTIGLTNTGEFTLGNTLYYNRVLTDAEVLQNYNAQKSRFNR